MARTLRTLATVCVIASIESLTGCSSASSESARATTPGGWQSRFDVDKADLVSSGTNPYFVLEPGFQSTLEGREGKKHLQLVITVLNETVMVDGVETRIVEERETVNGKPVEVSRNFFAISKLTHDVYYFGEEVDIYEDGQVTKHEGAWRSGVAGARFGLVMPGQVAVGRKYQQEIAPDVAMDRFEITSTEATFETPAGRFEHCVKVEETSPLEPKDRESKHYAPGIGIVQDEDLLLVAYGMKPAPR